MEEVKYIKETVTGEITEKKSRFIATLSPVKSEDEAVAFINSLRKKYYDARHNCYAYITGGAKKSSDDGEPAHTAGRPMMDILEKEGLSDVCVVVTRYFGGVLLGTGGLVRAYQGAVRAALDNAQFFTRSLRLKLHITCDYNDHGKITYYASSGGFETGDTEFSDKVSFDLYIAPSAEEECIKKISGLTDGRAEITPCGEVYK